MSEGCMWKDQRKNVGQVRNWVSSDLTSFPELAGHVTVSDDSVGTGGMGAGFV